MPQNVRKSSFAVCLVAVGALVAIPAVAQKSPVPQPIPVNVENTPNVNVANTPSVSVTNTPNVSVANTPSVTVSNTPSVNIANTPSVNLATGATVAVTSPLDGSGNPAPVAVFDAFQPYDASCIVSFNGNNMGSCDFLPAVPTGKLLVIQEFDAIGLVETGNRPQSIIAADHYFAYTFMGNYSGIDDLATHQETRLYWVVNPDGALQCLPTLQTASNGVFECDVSGYLVDASLLPPGIPSHHPKLPLSQLLKKLPAR